MTALTMNQIQHNYRERKQKLGWKRIQIWKLDDTNLEVKKRVKKGALLANISLDEKKLLEDLSTYTDKSLKNIPL